MVSGALTYDVAISYARSDSWAARDIHRLLSGRGGFRVYCAELEPQRAAGILRSNLMDIYAASSLNLVLWSSSYATEVDVATSIIAAEFRVLSSRHVERGEPASLVVLALDHTPPHRRLEDLLRASLQSTGITGLWDLIVDRLFELRARQTARGAITHPPNTEGRGTLVPCDFTINSSFESDPLGRWERMADIWAVFPNPLNTEHVYLIPSGLAPTWLRAPLVLTQNPKWLAHKRQASAGWARANREGIVKGFYFAHRKGETEICHLYCPSYDHALQDYLAAL